MERDKFENELKERLENRRIEPSASAWQALEDQLNAENKRRISPFWQWGIVASVVAILMVFTLFFRNENPVKNTIEVVETEADSIQKETPQKQPIKMEEVVVESSRQKVEPDVKQLKKPIKEAVKTHIAETSDKNEENISETPIDSFLTAEKIKEAIVKVKQKQGDSAYQKSTVTDVEIENLLAEARQKIEVEKRLDGQRIDATALLQDAESDLDKSFREEVLKTILSGYKTVKTAVAQRNE